jgi:6-pyruvoyltetrahydropterin/6-carboxytetrahydropterin synthase
MKCTIDRRAQFSASHRYWLPELSEAENFEQLEPVPDRPVMVTLRPLCLNGR